MNWRNRLLLGSAASLVLVAGAQAADLPVKAKPVEYVKICTAYGAGFYYIPGTDICLRVGGFVYVETGYNGRGATPLIYTNNIGNDLTLNRDDNVVNFRARGSVIMDARAATSIGTVRTYFQLGAEWANNTAGASAGTVAPYLERAFIQFSGFTAGFAASFFDFGSFYSITSLASIPWHWAPLFAYTAQLGNGFSATLSIEDGQALRTKLVTFGAPAWTGVATTASSYGGQQVPDIVANLRVSQAWGTAQIMGAIHQLRVNQAAVAGGGSDAWGWAVGGGIEVKLPMIAPGDSIMLQGVYSVGAVEYTGLSASASSIAQGIGLKNAAGFGPATDLWDAALSCGAGTSTTDCRSVAWSANLMFRHFWQPNLRSAFWVGYNKYEPKGVNPFSPDLKIVQAGGNIVWSPAPTLDLSLDVLWSRLESGICTGAQLGVTCGMTADLWTVWTRWRRNF